MCKRLTPDNPGSTITVSKVVTEARFTVPDPADSGVAATTCTTFFSGMASVTITDTQAGGHDGTAFTLVSVARKSTADAKCTTLTGAALSTATATVTVPANSAAASLTVGPQAIMPKLVDVPYGQTDRCVYVVEFPDDFNSAVADPVTSAAVRLDAPNAPADRQVELSNEDANTRVATLTYDAVRPAQFELVNITGIDETAHEVANMEDVVVTLAHASGTTCNDSVPVALTVEAGAADTNSRCGVDQDG